MAYMTPADFILRYDANRVAELLTTNPSSPVSPLALSGNSSLLAIIDDAEGEVEAAVTIGNKYTPADLAAMTGRSLQFLKRLIADITWANLLVFKGLGDGDVEAQAPRYKQAREVLQQLYNGSMVFGIDGNREAGLPKFVEPNARDTNSPTLINRLFGTYGYYNGYR